MGNEPGSSRAGGRTWQWSSWGTNLALVELRDELGTGRAGGRTWHWSSWGTNLALVELGNGAQEVEGPDVPDLGVADDLHATRVEHPTQGLVQLVQLVDLPPGPTVPQHPVTQHQLVRRVEAGPVVAVLVGVLGLERAHLLPRGDVIDGGHTLGPRANHLVLNTRIITQVKTSAADLIYFLTGTDHGKLLQ